MADHQTVENIKHVADAAAVGTVIGTIAGWLPAIAALFTIVWTGIRIFESETVQRFLRRHK